MKKFIMKNRRIITVSLFLCTVFLFIYGILGVKFLNVFFYIVIGILAFFTILIVHWDKEVEKN